MHLLNDSWTKSLWEMEMLERHNRVTSKISRPNIPAKAKFKCDLGNKKWISPLKKQLILNRPFSLEKNIIF